MNNLKKYIIILFFTFLGFDLYAQTEYRILAVDTNPAATNYKFLNYTNDLKMSNGITVAWGIKSGVNPSITDSNIATLGDLKTYYQMYSVTNTYVISNTLDFAVQLQQNRTILDDIRFYLSETNNAPFSKRASIQLFRNSNRRCDKMVYLDTNQLYWVALNTTATAASSGSNTVADASGVVLNDLYYIKDNTTVNEFCRPTNTTATIIYWGSTNLNAYTTTSLVSHVNQFGGFPYYDELNTSQMWFRLTFTTPYTTTVQTVINYGR